MQLEGGEEPIVVAQDEGDPLLRAEVGDPAPGEDTLDGHHDVLAVRRDRGQQVLRGGGAIAMDAHLALGVQPTDVHPSGVQIDPTVVAMLRSVESHPVSSLPRRGGVVWPQSPYPDAWHGGLYEDHHASADRRLALLALRPLSVALGRQRTCWTRLRTQAPSSVAVDCRLRLGGSRGAP